MEPHAGTPTLNHLQKKSSQKKLLNTTAERGREARKKAATRLEEKAFSREDSPARLAGRRRKREIVKNALMRVGKPATSSDVKAGIAMRDKGFIMEQQQRSLATGKKRGKAKVSVLQPSHQLGIGGGSGFEAMNMGFGGPVQMSYGIMGPNWAHQSVWQGGDICFTGVQMDIREPKDPPSERAGSKI